MIAGWKTERGLFVELLGKALGKLSVQLLTRTMREKSPFG